jgi:uncharacterized protein YdaU (DUF1376 family)
MNYFELHIGDLSEATAHLTMLEDGAYNRLLRKYYATEKPLPADIKQVQRLAGARTKEEREAVENVLREFFTLHDDGWHQSRCDAEIAAFRDWQVNKEGKRENAKERQRRARERRASLFEALRTHGIVASWSTTTAELETLLSRVTGAHESQPVTPPVTCDDTANPLPTTHYPPPNVSKPPDGGSGSAPSAAPPTTPAAKASPPTATASAATPEPAGGDEAGRGYPPTTYTRKTPPAAFQAPSRAIAEAHIPPAGAAPPPAPPVPPVPPPPFDGTNAEALNGRAVVPLAAAFELPLDWGFDAEKLGFPVSAVMREAERFRQYWTVGKGQGTRRSVKGWRQSWSNWLSKAERNAR